MYALGGKRLTMEKEKKYVEKSLRSLFPMSQLLS